MHPSAPRGTWFFLKAVTHTDSLTFLPNTAGTQRVDPGDPSCVLSPNLQGSPNLHAGERKRPLFHRAAIVEGSWAQNDNVDDCLPTVVSCSCTSCCPLNEGLSPKGPGHKWVRFPRRPGPTHTKCVVVKTEEGVFCGGVISLSPQPGVTEEDFIFKMAKPMGCWAPGVSSLNSRTFSLMEATFCPVRRSGEDLQCLGQTGEKKEANVHFSVSNLR